ncbi:MAG: hypothetical protein QW035_02235 [Candidatus Anstonellales archaeon]
MEKQEKLITELMAAERKYLELHFITLYKLTTGVEAEQELQEKAELERRIAELHSKLSGLKLFFPFQNNIEALTARISAHTEQEVVKALREKSGELYELIKSRGVLIRQNFDRQEDIARLICFVNRLGGSEEIIKMVKEGKWDREMQVKDAAELAKHLNRAGITCKAQGDKVVPGEMEEKERLIQVDERKIWLPAQKAEELERLLKELNEVNLKIQLKNAERQIKVFSEQEEKDFTELQIKYLELIKKKKEIIG